MDGQALTLGVDKLVRQPVFLARPPSRQTQAPAGALEAVAKKTPRTSPGAGSAMPVGGPAQESLSVGGEGGTDAAIVPIAGSTAHRVESPGAAA